MGILIRQKKPISLILSGSIIFILSAFNVSAVTATYQDYSGAHGHDNRGELSAKFTGTHDHAFDDLYDSSTSNIGGHKH